jgi:hypothetical protein
LAQRQPGYGPQSPPSFVVKSSKYVTASSAASSAAAPGFPLFPAAFGSPLIAADAFASINIGLAPSLSPFGNVSSSFSISPGGSLGTSTRKYRYSPTPTLPFTPTPSPGMRGTGMLQSAPTWSSSQTHSPSTHRPLSPPPPPPPRQSL